MLPLLLFMIVSALLTAAGRQMLSLLRLPVELHTTERNLYGFALGLGLFAYGMLAIGLLGLLTLPFALTLLFIFTVLGIRQWSLMGTEITTALSNTRLTATGWGIGLLFFCFALVSVIGVYSPPNTLEWDSLAYHLADPKLYLQAHRIYYLPWESHSNFAFTAEMWYTFGLMVSGVPLAKMFHFACAAGTCLTVYTLGRTFLTARTGLWAAMLFAATPLVYWEAGTAYTDLATSFFATLTLLALARALAAPENMRPWLTLSGVLMGLTLSTKATSLFLLGLLALGLLLILITRSKHSWQINLRLTAGWIGIALLIGAPWYVKSAIYTGNPVYPFGFHLFGGHYWNAVNSAAYDQSNAAFGMGHAPINLFLVPWNLTMGLLPGHYPNVLYPFNNFATRLMTLSPVLLAAVFFPVFGKGTPRVIKYLGVYALGAVLFWFWSAQHVRYLLPVLPVLCLLAAWVVTEALRARWYAGYALAALLGVSLAFSLWTGVYAAAKQLPVVLGKVTADSYLDHTYSGYAAIRYVNTKLPVNARLVFYGSPLGYYCDRPYLWGEAMHSAYIPYEKMRNAEDLNQWYAAHGVTHILINPVNFAMAPGETWPGWVYALTAAKGTPVFSSHGVQVYALPPPK